MFHKILIPVSLILALSSEVSAQFVPNAIGITASVRDSEIEIVTLQPINLAGTERVDGIVTLDPVQSAGSGKMMALGNGNTEFRINFQRIRELTNTSGPGLIFIEYAVSGNPLDEQETSELFEEESRQVLFSDEGNYYFWIGGRIDLNQATPGAYEGEFTIEIEYL